MSAIYTEVDVTKYTNSFTLVPAELSALMGWLEFSVHPNCKKGVSGLLFISVLDIITLIQNEYLQNIKLLHFTILRLYYILLLNKS